MYKKKTLSASVVASAIIFSATASAETSVTVDEGLTGPGMAVAGNAVSTVVETATGTEVPALPEVGVPVNANNLVNRTFDTADNAVNRTFDVADALIGTVALPELPETEGLTGTVIGLADAEGLVGTVTGLADAEGLVGTVTGLADAEGLTGTVTGLADAEGLVGTVTSLADTEGLVGTVTGLADTEELTSSVGATGGAALDATVGLL